MDLVSPPAWAPPWLDALLFAAGCAAAAAFLCLPFQLWRIQARLKRIETRLARPDDGHRPPARPERIEPSLRRS